jgi:hypothetical protein
MCEIGGWNYNIMKNLRITYNQIEVLDMIYSFRYLPLKVLILMVKRRGIYSFEQSLGKAVIKMEKQGIIKSFYYGNNWKVVYITKKGAEVLADVKNLDIKNVRVPNQGMKVSFSMLEHTVQIALFYEKFVSELVNYPQINLVRWLGDQRMLQQYSFHSTKSSKTVKRNLIPDSYIELEFNEVKHSYFLEYDTGSMDKEQLARKFMRYFEYFVYGDWQKEFGQYPTILFITDRSEERMANLFKESNSFDLNKALLNRYHFNKAGCLMTMAVAMSDNVRNIDSNQITDFLKLANIFTFTDKQWQKELLESLY